MHGLLTQPLVFGEGMAFIGLTPGACYGMAPGGNGGPRTVMDTVYGAAAVIIAPPQITILAGDSGQNGG